MPSELALHIGVNGRHRDGDILRVTFTYDAQRVFAEMISNGRPGAARDPAHVTELQRAYLAITDPNRQPQPTEADLNDWWTLCERLTDLDRQDFSRFPYTTPEQQRFLVVPLDREATPADRAKWTGKTAGRIRGTAPIPMRVDWEADVLPTLRVRRGKRGRPEGAANAVDVRDSQRSIVVLDAISASKIRDRA